ncbi:MAG: RagB/SusD family nutrient uptake outer membrane protein, partial [Bacteroidales bacterium]|nr:RagB/SusD family nutrient uptake outer membrane protein [Bacteroidales bacterium]
MKKYSILIMLALGAAAVSSCKDFLIQENPNKIESEYFFTDESSLILYTNGLTRSYATAIKSFIDGDKYSDAMSWDGEYLYYTPRYTAEDATNWTTSNWSSLRSINYYLENMRKAKAPEAVLDHYEGVGRFFRAMFYISKVQTFGAVPWYDHLVDPKNPDDIYMPRTNREEVCRNILKDLDYACTHCSTDASYRNRSSFIHRYVALAIKSRFCLYEGTYRKYHKTDPSTGAAWKADESKMY